jgi:hypothetical protein
MQLASKILHVLEPSLSAQVHVYSHGGGGQILDPGNRSPSVTGTAALCIVGIPVLLTVVTAGMGVNSKVVPHKHSPSPKILFPTCCRYGNGGIVMSRQMKKLHPDSAGREAFC